MRAAMMDPAVMLLDEPMAALIAHSTECAAGLKSIFSKAGETVLW